MAGLVVVGLLGLFFWLSGRWTHLYLFALLSFKIQNGAHPYRSFRQGSGLVCA